MTSEYLGVYPEIPALSAVTPAPRRACLCLAPDATAEKATRGTRRTRGEEGIARHNERAGRPRRQRSPTCRSFPGAPYTSPMILCPDEDGDEDVGAVLILPSSFSVLLMASHKAQNLGKDLFFSLLFSRDKWEHRSRFSVDS